jgi:very-short-patch-repair endonuclease
MLNDPQQKKQRRNLRKGMTSAEKALWRKLRSRRLQRYKFRRQASIDKYIVDFYCAEKKLVLEVDGDVHAFSERELHDAERQRFLESMGFKVVRFSNEAIKQSLDHVLERILRELK